MFIFDTNISIFKIQSKQFFIFLSLLIYLKGINEANYFIITIGITDALGKGMGDKVGSQRCSCIFIRHSTPSKLVFCKV